MIKRILAVALAMLLPLLLVACGLKDTVQNAVRGALTGSEDSTSVNSANAGNDEDKIDLTKAAEEMVADAIESNAFSTAAADAAMRKLGGLGLEQVKPDFPYILDDETMANYGDDSSYGHASFFFIKDGGDVTQEEYEAWLQKVYDATAAIADDGQNIQGYGFGDGDVPKSFEDVLSGGFMQVWSYKFNGQIMDVYPSTEYGSFTVNETKTYGTEDSGDIGVKIDITVGMQKPFDEYEQDIEDAFEQHGDEIRDILEDYAN